MTTDLDTLFALLAESRRRHLLYRLLESGYANVGPLSRHIAAFEAGTTVRAVSEDERRRVGVSLVHDHLPRLASDGLVEFDGRSGDVVTTEDFEAVRPVVERARLAENPGELADPSPLTVLYSEPSDDGFLADDV